MKQKLLQRYLSVKVLPIWIILLMDICIIALSCLLSFALRYDFRSIFIASSEVVRMISCTIVINLLFFKVFHTYSNVLRFSSFVDIMRIFLSLSVSYALLVLISILLETFANIKIAPVSVLFCRLFRKRGSGRNIPFIHTQNHRKAN